MKNLVFDIETTALDTETLRAIMPVFDPDSVKTGQYGPDKAAEKIERARLEHFNRFMRRAALSATTGQIAMIGIKSESELQILEGDEKTIIQDWLNQFETGIAQGAHWIGFCIGNFDLPFLVRRAWRYRLRIPYGIVRGRYLTGFFTDLLQLWNGSEYGNQFEVSLDDLAQYFGVGKKTANGADFGELLRYKPEAARAYLENDLEITWKIAEIMGALKGPLADQPIPATAASAPNNGPTAVAPIQFY